ncbi:MAG TPA: hypothetical protein VF210_08610 [Pseudomonadales bacterium]
MKLVFTLVSLLAAAGAFAETRALVIAGLGGTPEYETEFQRQAHESAERLRALAADVVVLAGPEASRERLQGELAALSRRAAAGDTAVVLLIGHGSFDDRDYRFNLPGPDPTGADLAAWLAELRAERQLVVVATSASGALQELFADPRRAVITATRSGGERNVTVFSHYFTAALSDASADTDKDGYVSSVEAFRFAETAVAGHYEQRKQMATEHPVLDGPEIPLQLARLDGGAEPSPLPAGAGERLAELEAEIAALKANKEDYEPDDYYARLQSLLLEVALLRRQPGTDGS